MGQRAMKCYHSRSICSGSLISAVRPIAISMHARAHAYAHAHAPPPACTCACAGRDGAFSPADACLFVMASWGSPCGNAGCGALALQVAIWIWI